MLGGLIGFSFTGEEWKITIIINNDNGNDNDNNSEHGSHDDMQMALYARKMFENFMLA